MNRINELINEIDEYNFENEAGYMKQALPWQELKSLLKEQPREQVFPIMTRPICFFDLETTGVDIEKDFIVEICVLKLNPDFTEEVKTMRINPGVPIPAEATAVHGITNEMVIDCPLFVSISKSLLAFISDCDIAGFNSNRFDVPFLYFMFQRVGLEWNWRDANLIDVRNIFVRQEERTLSAGVKFYLGEDHSEAHSSEADVRATKRIFFEQLTKYQLSKDLKELALYSNYDNEIIDLGGKFAKDKEGDFIFTFGKHQGKKCKNEKDYLLWMMNGTFPKDTKEMAKKIMMQANAKP